MVGKFPWFLHPVFVFIFSIIALQALTLTTVLYPAVISLLDLTLVATLLIRRKQLS